MKTLVIYDSKHGHTKRVAEEFEKCHDVVIIDKDKLDAELFIFLCPTYGDEELPLDMEDFLQNLKIKNRQYVICELGNYYGYDDFQFGAMKIIKKHLESLGWEEAFPGVSLDSLPVIDWDVFNQWKENLDNAIQKDFC